MPPCVKLKVKSKTRMNYGEKATFVLDEQVILKAKEVVNKGFFKSMNAFVETAIKDKLERIEKEKIKAAIIEASKDPLFLSGLKKIERDFKYADFERTETDNSECTDREGGLSQKGLS